MAWTGKINGITNPAKINGIAVANIGKIVGEEKPPGSFRFEVVTAGADTFQLPIYDGGTYDFHVDWGDSSNDDITAWNDAAANHSYAGAGTYNVVITGTIIGWRFANLGDKTLIHDISEWGVLDVGDLNQYFYGCSNLTISATDSMNCPNTTTFYYGFFGCASLTAIPPGLFDNCTLVINFSRCFENCTNLTSIPSGLFDKCILAVHFSYCFNDSRIINALPINLILYNAEIDTCQYMFEYCYDMIGEGMPFVNKAEEHGVTTHTDCFRNCLSLSDYNSIPANWGGGGA